MLFLSFVKGYLKARADFRYKVRRTCSLILALIIMQWKGNFSVHMKKSNIGLDN